MTYQHGNAAIDIRRRLLMDFYNGHFVPGNKLRLDELAQRYNVSITPIREALIGIEREGLLTFTANSGFEVRMPSIAELCDIYELREALECLAVGKLAANGASEELMSQLRHASTLRLNSANNAELLAADRHFHELICDNCGSAVLARQIRQCLVLSSVFNFADRYLRASTQRGVVRRNVIINREHDVIVDAIGCGDVKTARKVMSKHIASARKILKKIELSSKRKRKQFF